MNLKDEHINRFIEVYEKTFQEKITYQEAYDQCLQLVILLKTIYRPMTLEDFERVQARRRQTGDL
jgi:hypothetical protein